MNVLNNVDQLIASLQQFKASVPELEKNFDLTSFADLFTNSINELERANEVASNESADTVIVEEKSTQQVSAPIDTD